MDRLTVLQSFPEPRPTTNPYLVMLAGALREDPQLRVLNFSWRTALGSRYEVFHVHWPEIMVTGGTWPKRTVRQLLFLGLLAKLRLQRTAVVRTRHNLELPEGLGRIESWLLGMFERRTDLVIRLTDETPVAGPSSTIVHGHYRTWFAGRPHSAMVSGRFGYAGLIRRYKGVEALVAAFSSLPGPELSLGIGGKPSSAELSGALEAAARADPRILLALEFLPDDEFVAAVTAAELMVFPYRAMHNSGGVLAALSLDRPALVPDNAVNRALAAEVGPGWLHFFTAPLTAAALESALASARSPGRTPAPDLAMRGWDHAALAHKDAYLRALSLRRGRAEVLP